MYDYIIAGGGCAGLSLAYQFHKQDYPFRLLLVDQERKEKNDRTWCFWSATRPPHEDIISHRWSKIAIHSYDKSIIRNATPYAYYMIRGESFYRHVNAALDNDPRITRLYGLVSAIHNVSDCVEISVGDARYRAGLLFDSTFEPRALAATIPPAELLLQHFYGQFIEFEKPIFDSDVATLFDFRTATCDEMQFLYLLPFSATRALLEYTAFTPRLYPEERYTHEIQQYIARYLHDTAYQVIESERGVIPMTAHYFPRRIGKRVVTIGTKGGRIKPSTGFAFLRIQRDSELLALSTNPESKQLDTLPRDSFLYRVLDAMMIEVIRRHPNNAQMLFVRLFTRNPIQRVFALLDEELSFGKTIRLMMTMPWLPFCIALLRWCGRRCISHLTRIRLRKSH